MTAGADRFSAEFEGRHTEDVLMLNVGHGPEIHAGTAEHLDHAMARDLIEHVIQEANARVELGNTRAIQVEGDHNPGFKRVAGYFGFPHGSSVVCYANEQL